MKRIIIFIFLALLNFYGVIVRASPPPTITAMVPSINFTPNGDAVNDVFVVYIDNPTAESYSGKVFNVAGEFVANMVAGPGMDTLQWDGRDSGGEVVPGDLYYFVFTAQNTIQVIRFMTVFIGCTGGTIIRNIPSLPSQTRQFYDPYSEVDPYCISNYSVSKQTTTIVIRGTEVGEVFLVGGAKGFVNPTKGEKLIIGIKPTEAGIIQAKIFDGTGRLVKEFSTIASGSDGVSIQWDGKNSSGRAVPSGVYLVHIKGPGINQTKRTVILK